MKGLFVLVIAVLAFPWSSAVAQDDPFIWLEAPNDPAAIKWASDQTERTTKELSSLPEYPAVSAELKRSLGSAPPRPYIAFEGRHVLRFTKDLAHLHGLLEVADRGADGLPGEWRTVLDVNALRAREKKAYELQFFDLETRCAPPDYDRCLLGLSLGGADNGELKEFSLSSGKFVDGGFYMPAGRHSFAWLDADTVLISSSAFKDPLTAAGFSERPASARFENDHWRLERGDVEPVGTTIGYKAADKTSDDYVMVTTGFLVPTRYDYVHAGRRIGTVFQQRPMFDASDYLVEARTAVSRDGTQIDYYLLRPKKLAHPGETATLITGYGAFNATDQPDYLGAGVGGDSLLTWISRSGALARASIRGGGDRGAEWHEAAMGINRQRSYDDFLAVTADLEHGFTTADHMGVFGSSNGGLLAATVAIERPDMYGAVISDVPLTDMLRLPHMGLGALWLNEYGDPKDPAERAAILRYSPYQNVRKGVKYPPFMITSSTADDRVGPGHARKLAARLEAVGSTVYLYENQEGGHDVSDPLQRPELMSLRMAFLIDRLMSPSPAHN